MRARHLCLLVAAVACSRPDRRRPPEVGPRIAASDVHFTHAKSWARDADGAFAWVDVDAPGGFVFPTNDPSPIRLTTGDGEVLEVRVQVRSNELLVSPSTVTWSRVQDHLVAWVDDREVKRQRVRRVVRDGDTPIADFWRSWDAARALYRVPDLPAARRAWLHLAEHPARAEVEGQVARALGNVAYSLYTHDRFAEAADVLRRAEALEKRVDVATVSAEWLFHEGQHAHLSGAYLIAARKMRAAIAEARAAHDAAFAYDAGLRLGVTLAELGRFGEALELAEQPEVEVPRGTRTSIVANRAWIRTGAMDAGLIPVDYESVRADHRWAADTAFADHNFERHVNQCAREAAVLLKMGRVPEARARLDEIAKREDAIPPHARTFIETLRARVELREGAFAAARRRLERMAAPSRPHINGRCEAIDLLGQTDQAEGHLERALAHYREATACHEELDQLLVTVSASAQSASAHAGPDAHRARALVLLGRADEAFRLLDAARARILEHKIDALAVDGNTDLWFVYQTARRAEEQRRERGCAAAPTRKARAECNAELDALAHETEEAFARFQASVARRESTPRDAAWLGDLRRTLGPKRALLLISGHDDDVLHLLVDDDGVASSTAANPIAHWDARIAEVEHLFVVPDWHPRSFDPFLVAPNRSLSLLPHADVLLRDRHDRVGPPIVIADPDGTLPKAATEGEWVVEHLKARSIPKAHRAAWLEAVRTAGLLHYAGHAEGTRGDPWSVRLRLADGETLDVFDLLAEPALPRLVVLDGCATGPKARAGGGGLPAALVHRGAGHVITTSDVIEDGAGTAFVRDFYEANGAEHPVQAFRVAVAKSIERDDGAWETMRLWGR